MLLEVKELRVYFQIDRGRLYAVDNCSFQLNDNDILGIVGESGAGKSVLSKSILGLLDPPGHIEGGNIRYKGQELIGMSERRLQDIRGREIAYLIQNPMASFNPMFSIGRHLRSVLRMYGTDKADIGDRMTELLKCVKIEDSKKLQQCYPHQFSGGMLQRAAIAMALAGDPKILIADEPTTALDANIRRDILMLLRELAEKKHMSIILITHDFGVVREICGKIAVMNRGNILESGDARKICECPAHAYTKSLMEDEHKIRSRRYGE